MKKYDEGYVLAYVTVVLLVFCLVATTILTGALRNLQTQQNINEQTKSQYLAAGEIEKVLAQWDDCTFDVGAWVKIGNVETQVFCKAEDTTKGTVTLWAKSGTVVITCELQRSDGKYVTYDVSTAESGDAEEVLQ